MICFFYDKNWIEENHNDKTMMMMYRRTSQEQHCKNDRKQDYDVTVNRKTTAIGSKKVFVLYRSTKQRRLQQSKFYHPAVPIQLHIWIYFVLFCMFIIPTNVFVNCYLFQDDPANTNSVVVEYTGKDINFRSLNQPRVVNFYSPSCWHCRNFKSTYISVAHEMIVVQKREISFFAVSCEEHHDICKEYSIYSYPTVYVVYEAWDNGKTCKTVHFTTHSIEDALKEQVGKNLLEEDTNDDDDDGDNQGNPPKQQRQRQPLTERSLSPDGDDNNQGDDGIVQKKKNNRKKKNENDDDDNSNARKENEGNDNEYDDYNEKGSIKENKNEDYEYDENAKEVIENDYDESNGSVQENVDDEGDRGEDYQEEEKQEEDEEIEVELESEGIEEESYTGRDVPAGAAAAAAAYQSTKSMDKWSEAFKEKLSKRTSKGYSWKKTSKKQPSFIKSTKQLSANGNAGVNTGGDSSYSMGGATNIMKARRPGTVEYKDRMDTIASKLRSHKLGNKTSKKDTKGMLARNTTYEHDGVVVVPSYQKKLRKPILLEHVPIIRRTIVLSKEEQLILDASLAFIDGIKQGLFDPDAKKSYQLGSKEKDALRNWLNFLSIALPPEWSIHELIGDLTNNIDLISKSKNDLNSVLNKHPFPRKRYSESCNYQFGFHCGFWKLLHIASLGVAMHRGGMNLIEAKLVRGDAKPFSPLQAADTIREYMSYFYPCTECSNHFLAHYDVCENNRRCTRLSKSVHFSNDDDWKELAKWLWEVHNDFNVRILNEKHNDKRRHQQRSGLYNPGAHPGSSTLAEEMTVIWPSVESCLECFNEDGTFNENVIFLYLEHVYWVGDDLEDTPMTLLWFVDEESSTVFRWTTFLFMLSAMAFILVNNLINKNSVKTTMVRVKAIRTMVTGRDKNNKRSV